MKKKIISINYHHFLSDIQQLLRQARSTAARSVNSVMNATYWEVGRRIVIFEQKGEIRAGYGEELLQRLSDDLTKNLGRGFSRDNLELMRRFYLAWPLKEISETLSRKSALPAFPLIAKKLSLSWSHYSRLLRIKNPQARAFYESECLQGGWSIRQLDRQIDSQFYERTALSKNKAAMLSKGARAKPGDVVTPEEEIKNPYVLEFLGLKDEYSESELEEGLIRHLEAFLMELGGDFTFVARQRRLRVGNEWYRVDLVYHRRLRCLVLIDLKIGHFTHADAGQMHLYLNYAREHWTHKDENPPVGLILCAEKDEAVAKYALEGLPNKVLASEYKTALPKEGELVKEIQRTRKEFRLNSRAKTAKN
jgi:predicted nuclease of restriction endonuclease-like (RecB) superfamily